MGRRLIIAVTALSTSICATSAPGQTAPADPVLQRIKQEAAANSRIAEDLFQLTDAIGPRVVGSPAIRQAEALVARRLREYGLQNVRIEPNPPVNVGGGLMLDPPGWSWRRLTVQQLAPWQQTLMAVPVLYSPSTAGAVTGRVLVAPLPEPSDAEIAAFMGRHRGRLRNTFLLLSDKESPIVASEAPAFHRYTLEELKKMADAPAVAASEPTLPAAGPPPSEPPRKRPTVAEVFERHSRLFDFLRDEGVLALIGAARGGSQGGTLFVGGPPTPPQLAAPPPPMFDLAPEHFNRLLRLLQRDFPVRLEVHLESTFHEHKGTENVLAEIRGDDKADEVVLVGAHLDSWHGATGATDNAAGVAAVMEAVRILTTLRVPLRRTVHVAFWGGEEVFGLAGSRGYTQRYLLDEKGTKTKAWHRLSAYLNLDYGSGRIRGIYLQGGEKLKPLFDAWLAGIGDGTLVATLRTTLGSDQATFERIGIPGLSFIQDPLNYEQRTHHTNMDVADYVLLDDVKESAATLASVIYRVANADALLPRKSVQ